MVQRLVYRSRQQLRHQIEPATYRQDSTSPEDRLVFVKRRTFNASSNTLTSYEGLPYLTPSKYKRSRSSRNKRTVNRAYGGVLSGCAVRERIIQAFLAEQKIVKKVLKLQKAKEKRS